jgi:hypothetical protein
VHCSCHELGSTFNTVALGDLQPGTLLEEPLFETLYLTLLTRTASRSMIRCPRTQALVKARRGLPLCAQTDWQRANRAHGMQVMEAPAKSHPQGKDSGCAIKLAFITMAWIELGLVTGSTPTNTHVVHLIK